MTAVCPPQSWISSCSVAVPKMHPSYFHRPIVCTISLHQNPLICELVECWKLISQSARAYCKLNDGTDIVVPLSQLCYKIAKGLSLPCPDVLVIGRGLFCEKNIRKNVVYLGTGLDIQLHLVQKWSSEQGEVEVARMIRLNLVAIIQ